MQSAPVPPPCLRVSGYTEQMVLEGCLAELMYCSYMDLAVACISSLLEASLIKDCKLADLWTMVCLSSIVSTAIFLPGSM